MDNTAHGGDVSRAPFGVRSDRIAVCSTSSFVTVAPFLLDLHVPRLLICPRTSSCDCQHGPRGMIVAELIASPASQPGRVAEKLRNGR